MREGFALSNLNERCEQILQILTRAGDYITLKEIANRTGVSRRSIYYDICNINDWLDDHGLNELEAERGRGILLSAAEKEAISAAMGEKEFEEYYQFLPSDRQKIIITYIIQSEEPVYIEQLIDICHVSRNTVFGDIKIVVQLLNEYSLELRYEPKKGYVIFGSPVQIRALFILYYQREPVFDLTITQKTRSPLMLERLPGNTTPSRQKRMAAAQAARPARPVREKQVPARQNPRGSRQYTRRRQG